MVGMPIAARVAEPKEIESLRKCCLEEMNCQVVHESIHWRPGWTREYALDIDGAGVGYGSLALDGPWREQPALYEFYVLPERRMRVFDLFAALLAACEARKIETQSNARLLTVMLHTFARNIRAEAVVFEDGFETSHHPAGADFRAVVEDDAERMRDLGLDGGWVATIEGEVAAAGDVLYHYNRPYGDVYMAVGEAYRRRGLGAYLVQGLKAVCRRKGGIPAARCGVDNLLSRKTLQRAGFIPCGNILTGEIA
jgi:GNAT superfamily N-acetyltransferase